MMPAYSWSVALVALLAVEGAPALDAAAPLPRVEISAELQRLRAELGFEVKGLDLTSNSTGLSVEDAPVARLHLLLENFDHVIIQSPSGGIERVIILGEKADYVPPVVSAGTDSASPGQADQGPGGEIILPTQRQGASHVVTLGLEGPRGQRVEESMLIDTGADRIVLPMSMLANLGLTTSEMRVQEVQTANGGVQARIGMLNAVWVGERREEGVEAAFIEDDKLGGTALLGMSLLRRFRMTIDDEKSQLTLAAK